MEVPIILIFLVAALQRCSCLSELKSHRIAVADERMGPLLNYLYTNSKNRSKFNIEELRKVFLRFEDTLTKRMDKWRKKNSDNDVVVKDLLDLIMKDNAILNDDLKKIMKNVPPRHHEKLIRKLKKYLGSVSKDNDPKKMNAKRKKQWKGERNRKVEDWIGQNFVKPHHTSADEAPNTKDMEMLQSINLAMEQRARDKDVEAELEQNHIGRALLKGLLEERYLLPLADNATLNQMSDPEKKDYFEAERKWEEQLTQETQRLLENLHPAEAYVIPDLDEYNEQLQRIKKMKEFEAARKMRRMLQRAKRRRMKGKKKAERERKGGDKKKRKHSIKKKQLIPYRKEKSQMLMKKGSASRKNIISERQFIQRLADEEEEWIGLDMKAWKKIHNLEKLWKTKSRKD